MSMSRKLKKKLLAAATALTVLGTGAANVDAAPLDATGGTVMWGSVTYLGNTFTTGSLGDIYSGTAIVVNQNTLINWTTFNMDVGQSLGFGAPTGIVLVNQVTGGASTIKGEIFPDSLVTGGQVYLISPYGITTPGASINGISVFQNQALISTVDQFNSFLANPGGTTPVTPVNPVTPVGPITPVGPTPAEEAAAALRAAEESGKLEQALNALDSMRNDNAAEDAMKALIDAGGESFGGGDDAAKAAQEALEKAQGNQLTNVQDHVYVVTPGAGQNNTGLNVGNLFGGGTPITVQEASSRVRNIAKDYLKALESGDKAKAEALKQQLKDANDAVKALKEQEKNNSADEAAKALQDARQGEQWQPKTLEEARQQFPDASELLKKNEEQKQPQQQQGGGSYVTQPGGGVNIGTGVNYTVIDQAKQRNIAAARRYADLVKSGASKEELEAARTEYSDSLKAYNEARAAGKNADEAAKALQAERKEEQRLQQTIEEYKKQFPDASELLKKDEEKQSPVEEYAKQFPTPPSF